MVVPDETARLARCLERLAPVFLGSDVALTGGVAVEYYLAAAGLPALRTCIADIDFVARRTDELAPALAGTFLVSHYHRAGPGVPKAMLQLVDPEVRLRIDIFPDLGDTVASAQSVEICGTPLLVLTARSIFEHKLRTVAKASEASPADPKHWADAATLAALCGFALPEPALHLRRAVLGTDVASACARCELSRGDGVPLAPKQDIFAILGYV